jgi:hypothetical protein
MPNYPAWFQQIIDMCPPAPTPIKPPGAVPTRSGTATSTDDTIVREPTNKLYDGRHGQVRLVDDGNDPVGQGESEVPDPRIDGPASDPQYEQNGYDLQDQFPDGQGPVFGGDPRVYDEQGNPVNVPRSPATELAPGPDGTRPLPTGTAIGPDGRRYAFFSHPSPVSPAGTNEFATAGSVYDFTDPAHPVKVADLTGIFQASGAYDAASNRMVIVGNTSNLENPNLPRGLWVSDPINPNSPNSWVNTLHNVGNVSLAGDRESQLVSLPGNRGFLLVGASNGLPVSGAVASTPEGLMTAPVTNLVQQGNPPAVYGPTITGLSYDAVTGKVMVGMRVSSWVESLAPDHYDPRTFTTNFTVTAR